MTFKNFETLFKGKYPDGTAYAHDVFEHRAPGRIQKVAVTFAPDGKVYMYRGAYEDILCKIGIPVISKERLKEMETRLERLKESNGDDNFFGGTVDNTQEIAELEAELARIMKECVVA